MENKFELKIADERFEKIENRLEKMKKRAFEFAPSRSSFQIEKFIGCDEYTPVTKYRHLAHNSYVMMTNVRDMILEREKILRRIEKLKKDIGRNEKWMEWTEEDKEKNLDIRMFSLFNSLEDIEISIKGSLQEIEVFERLCDQLEKEHGRPFTYQDFEEDQPNYWKLRLSSQMHFNQFAAKVGIGEGNYKSYIQAIEDPIDPNSRNTCDKVNLDFESLAVTSLINRKGANTKMLQRLEENKE